jgi:STE24 endopeptidase
MHPFTILFVVALAASVGVELWLLARQIHAVHAHRGRVPAPFAAAIGPDQHARAADYAVARARLAIVERLAAAVLAFAFTVGGGIAAIDQAVAELGLAGLPHQVASIGAFALTAAAFALPFDAWRTFRTEAAFGFNRTTPALFAGDVIKGLAISAALVLPLAALVLLLMDRAGAGWWLFASAAWAAFAVAAGWAWPRLVAPLFNRFSELAPGPLRDGVEALSRRCGFEPRGVYVMDGSRRSAHGNAYFTGLGRNQRIVFFDTLVESLAPAELEAVLAHELGHYRLRHVALRLAASLAAATGGFALLAWLGQQSWLQPALGVPGGGPHTLLLLFVVAAPVFLFWLRPLWALLSRRHEFAADRFAARHADAAALADALVKLYRDNAATLTPDRLYAAFHAGHPPALARIARLAPGRYG